MTQSFADVVGAVGAVLTTFCWLPQVVKIVRERDTRAISFPANFACALGVACWLIYGAALPDWPLITSSAVRSVSITNVTRCRGIIGIHPLTPNWRATT